MMTTPLKVIPREDLEIEFEGKRYLLKAGEEIEVPKFLAIALNLDVLRLKASEIKGLIMKEREEDLVELSENFYDRCELNPKDESKEAKNFRIAFNEFLGIRLEKLSRLATYSAPLRKKIPHEERVLYNTLSSVVEKWRKERIRRIFGD
ncbi:MAG: hypothetical protein ACE5K0_11880 [Candidatus Methanofastidiosia archaeon]